MRVPTARLSETYTGLRRPKQTSPCDTRPQEPSSAMDPLGVSIAHFLQSERLREEGRGKETCVGRHGEGREGQGGGKAPEVCRDYRMAAPASPAHTV